MLNWFTSVSLKIGGPREKRNLLGVLIDGLAIVLKAPFGVWVVGVWFGHTLFTDPKEATQWASFQGMRFVQALSALCGVRYWVDPNGRMRWSATTLMNFITIYFIAQLFTSVFLAMGWITAWLLTLIIPPLVLILMGVRTAIWRWKYQTYDDYKINLAAERAEEQARAASQRRTNNDRLQRAIYDREEETRRMATEQARQQILKDREEGGHQRYDDAHNNPGPKLPPYEGGEAIDVEFKEVK